MYNITHHQSLSHLPMTSWPAKVLSTTPSCRYRPHVQFSRHQHDRSTPPPFRLEINPRVLMKTRRPAAHRVNIQCIRIKPGLHGSTRGHRHPPRPASLSPRSGTGTLLAWPAMNLSKSFSWYVFFNDFVFISTMQ